MKFILLPLFLGYNIYWIFFMPTPLSEDSIKIRIKYNIINIRNGIIKYKKTENKLPKKIEDLIPKYLRFYPKDLYNEYLYLDTKEYRVFSAGPDKIPYTKDDIDLKTKTIYDDDLEINEL